MARFDFSYAAIEAPYLSSLYHYLPIHIIITLIIFYLCRMYHSLWKFVGVHELGYMLVANAIAFVVQIAGMYLMQYPMPRSYYCFSDLTTDCDGHWIAFFLPFSPSFKRGEEPNFYRKK